MKRQEITVRLCAWVCVVGVVAMLLRGGFPLLLYLEVGRQVRFPAATAPPVHTEPPATVTPVDPTQPEAALPAFSQGDLQYIQFLNFSSKQPDLSPLLAQPLSWDLTGEGPTVLILHTHGSEGYAGTEGYRSEEPGENMVAIGREVARVLEAGGISVLHDTTLYDLPSYTDSYANARKAIQTHLAEHPTIRLVLDLHRDASSGTEGQLTTSATVGGQPSAQLMLVVGTDDRLNHPDWQENLALALKLTAALEQYNPGICRPVSLRAQRFNMDLTPGSLLVEVGAAGNTRQEAILAANALAQAVLYLARGTA